QGNEQLQLFRKTATGGESSVQISIANGTPPTVHAKAAVAIVYRNVDPTNPLDGVPSPGTNGALKQSVTATGITTTQANDQLLMVESGLDNTTASWTPPVGMTNRVERGANLVSLAIADKPLGAAGATGDQTATLGNQGSLAAYLLALRPTQSTTYA